MPVTVKVRVWISCTIASQGSAAGAAQQPDADQRRATSPRFSVGRQVRQHPPRRPRPAAPRSRRRSSSSARPGDQRAVVAMQVLAAERAQGVLAVAGSQVVERDAPVALLREGAHGVRQRHPGGRVVPGAVSAQQRQRLQVDAAHGGRVFQREGQDLPEAVQVDAARHRGHQHHAQTDRRAALHGAPLAGGQRPPAERAVRLVVDAVELHEHRVQARLGQALRVARLGRQPQAVVLSCKKPWPRARPRATTCGRSSRTVGSPPESCTLLPGATVEQASVPPLDRVDRGVGRRLPPGVGEAHGTSQVAARRDLEQHAARLTRVARAQSARARARRTRGGLAASLGRRGQPGSS